MITHADAATAHERAQKLRDVADIATSCASQDRQSVFSLAFAEAKRREAHAAATSAYAQALWARWSFPGLR